MSIVMPSSRGSSYTIIGAISEKLGLVHYHIFKGTNDGENFKHFISELVRKIKGVAYVYMDNYAVHKTLRVRDYFNENVQQRFLPAYSCTLNPIERLWNVAKQKWGKRMLEKPEVMGEEEMLRELKEVMESLRDTSKRLARSHVDHIIQVLGG